MSKVQCFVYDITQGMAAGMSQALIGKTIDYVPHTGIVVFGTEYFFGGGPCTGVPGQTVGIPVYKTLDLGETSKTREELELYISSTLTAEYNEGNYSLLHHNCNHYADAVSKFLLDGKGLPNEIVNIAAEALSSPQGQQLKVMIENMEKSMRSQMGGGSGLNPFAANTGATPSAPVMPGMPAMPPVTPAPACSALVAAAKPEVNAELEAALSEIGGNDKEVQIACLSTLVKIFENIEKNPVEPKFRKIKMSNGAFAKKVVGCNGGVEAMLAAGWMPDVDPDGEDVWMCGDENARSQGGPLKVLKAALQKLQPAPPKPAAAAPRYGTDAPPPGQGYGAGGGAPLGMPGAGGLPGMGGGMGGLPPGMANNPMVQQMMNNPAMMAQAQQMMNNPAAMQQMQQQLQNNPQMAAQMQQMMSDPNAMANLQNMMGGGRGGF